MSASDNSRSLIMLLLCVFAAAPAQALQIVTEENPPFNYTENNKLTGLSTDVIMEMGRRANVPMTFAVMPWPQGYEQTQRKPETCIYSTVRLENRERIFKWVGPLATNAWGLFAKGGFNDPVKTLADARPYRIGGVTNDAKVAWLRDHAVTNIVAVREDKQIPPMLTLDRKQFNGVDLWVTGIRAEKIVAANAGVKDIKLVLKFNEVSYWLACHPGIPDGTVKGLVDALAAMTKDGTLQKIARAYDR